MRRCLLQLFTAYVIVSFVTACATRQVFLNGVNPTGELIEDEDGAVYQITEDEQLYIQGRYDLYESHGFEFIWHLRNKSEAPVDFNPDNVFCTLENEETNETVPAFNPDDPDSDFEGTHSDEPNLGGAILTIIGIVLIVGIFILMASNDDDNEDNEDDYYIPGEDEDTTIIVQQKTEIHVYDDTPVTVVQSADNSKQTIIVGHPKEKDALDSATSYQENPVLNGWRSIPSGQVFSTRIRCPQIPPMGTSTLTIQAGMAGKHYFQTYEVLRVEPPPRTRAHTQT